ncbi:MAG: segregation/condensation protein A [Phycisphaeraceae bacterium]
MPPADEYRVQLQAYAGPLDLLLYLVKRHEIDLHDIPVAELTEQYLDHLKLIEAIDVDKAGEFLVMAATLLEIKSQMILPRPDADAEQAEGDVGDATSPADPRYELVQQLLAYKRYKDAARALEERQDRWSARAPATATPATTPDDRAAGEGGGDGGGDGGGGGGGIDLDDVNVLDLCQAFSRILDSIGQRSDHQVTVDDTPLGLHAADIHDRLLRDGPMTLQQIFEGRTNHSEMIGLFLATLELVREKKIRVTQDQIAGEIRLESIADRDDDTAPDADAPTDWRDPATGEIEYDWPDAAARRRAERRAKIREARAKRGDFSEPDDDELDALDETDNDA